MYVYIYIYIYNNLQFTIVVHKSLAWAYIYIYTYIYITHIIYGIQDSRINKIQELQQRLLGSEDKAFPDPRLGSAVDPSSTSTQSLSSRCNASSSRCQTQKHWRYEPDVRPALGSVGREDGEEDSVQVRHGLMLNEADEATFDKKIACGKLHWEQWCRNVLPRA